ncbi:winged helix-turn-helix transcriptional regulator [Cloacibacterium sp.]|uniref:winged helix-turn-helix transcriptional regulator n=1 Tax=Cloacibacterium sp. TaxID=1913682 RepID=UPI0039E58883
METPHHYFYKSRKRTFTDIQESIPGITPKVHAKELKDLEQHKLIKRTIIDEYPIKISYTIEPFMHLKTGDLTIER